VVSKITRGHDSDSPACLLRDDGAHGTTASGRLSKSSGTSKDSDAIVSDAALAHGELRYRQGYTPAMLVQESRILQVTIFGTLQSNLNSLDFSLLLPDVMTIVDEVDAQLTRSMESYMQVMRRSAAA
jgi:hypothetical protein